MTLQKKPLENIVGKGVCPSNSNFSFLPQCFLANKVQIQSFNPFPNNPWFLRVCSKSLLKTLWKKEKLLITSNFSLSYSVFYPSEERSSIFFISEIVVCKLFQFGRV